MLSIIAIIVVCLIAAVLLLASTKPATFRIARSATINATPERVHALINDFQRWTAWSPWEKKDPAMQRSYGSSTAGVGAVYSWQGNKNVGEGRMEIVESTPVRIVIKLDFFKPFEAHNTAEFTLAQQGSATEVNWVMHGPNTFIGKVMQLFFSMDNMVGKDFEAGLVALKANAEQ
ncbi:hypothetical protein IGB42_03565 [Andreprevotia sp. IGB-42]|uniref:SRPBCC family protein n=1 Tax=Andreprevotia sp. IGB-42 TaxID=2497473 RepID=UPI00135C56A5|nr:SRPBCC family protein [Andreprevotia sp. IGB-42]KAF0812023.1 hypothetical protein IGB42_03565 [Andreprevotia sp. IGB-42]